MSTTVRMLQGIASATWAYDPDELVEVSPEQAEAWIRAGIAEPAAVRRHAPENASMRPAARSRR